MDYRAALRKLITLRDALRKHGDPSAQPTPEEYEELCRLYGQCEEVITRFAGDAKIKIEQGYGASPLTYPNYIEAGFLSGRTIHVHQGQSQLNKIIGKVEQLIEDPEGPPAPISLSGLLQILGRFRECCQYVKNPPNDEREVQDILWIMLRSQYERVDREDTLPKFGIKGYKPDFGLPDLQALIEVKFVGEKTSPSEIQEEILADIPGYINQQTRFTGVVELVYDHAHKLRDARKFIEDLRAVPGIIDVIVVPGIS